MNIRITKRFPFISLKKSKGLMIKQGIPLPEYKSAPPPLAPNTYRAFAHLPQIKNKVVNSLIEDLRRNINPQGVNNYIKIEDNCGRLIETIVNIPQVRTEAAHRKVKEFGIDLGHYFKFSNNITVKSID